MNLFESEQVYVLFGEFVRQERIKQELTQKQVASKLGITQTSYCYIEQGTRQVAFPVILNVCEVLGLNINDFLTILRFQTESEQTKKRSAL